MLAFHCLVFCSYAQEKVTISYVGNMGVLIGNEKEVVLIDGFHKEYRPQYVFPPDSVIQKITSAEYEGYGTLDIAIATHFHQDHFDPGYFYDFLNLNTASIAILSPQIKKTIDDMGREGNAALPERIMTFGYDGKIYRFQHNGIEVRAFRCDHVSPSRHRSVENTAYIVTLNDNSILHVGDSNWEEAEQHLIEHEKSVKGVDLAVLPYWMLLGNTSKNLVERLISPGHLVATHIPPDLEDHQAEKLSKNFPGIVLFTELGQKFELPKKP